MRRLALILFFTGCGELTGAIGNDGAIGAEPEAQAAAEAPRAEAPPQVQSLPQPLTGVAGALAVLSDRVIPNLVGSWAFTLDDADNLARMQLIRRDLDAVVAILRLPVPDPARAAAALRVPIIPLLEMSPGWKRTKQNNPNDFAKTKLAVARAGMDTAIALLTGNANGTSAQWQLHDVDVAGAKALLEGTALPNLTGASVFRLDQGDNLARMAIVEGQVRLAIAILSAPVLDGTRARAVLRSPALPLLYESPGWQRAKTANPDPVVFATTKIAIAAKAMEDAAQKLTPSAWPTVASKTRGKNGLYFYNWPGALGEAEVIRLAKQHGLWVAILVNETDHTPMRSGQYIPEAEIFGIRDRIKAAGVTVVASGWADPSVDLDRQAATIGRMSQGFDEYLLNIEAAWAWTHNPAADPTPGFLASAAFAPKVRAALGPNMPLSISIDWGNAIHFKPWLEAGASAVRVQSYLNQWTHKTPLRALELLGQAQGDLPQGVPPSMREVTYGKYGAWQQPLTSFSALDDEAGRPPRSVWAAEFCDAADISWLAR